MVVKLAEGALGRSLCLSELSRLSAEFTERLQIIEWQVRGRTGLSYPPVGSLYPPLSVL